MFGAKGLVHSFMDFNIGLNLASKLNALSVYFCLRICHVSFSLCTCVVYKQNALRILENEIVLSPYRTQYIVKLTQTCGVQRPIMMLQKPKRLPNAVFVSMATSIHLFSNSARSDSVAHVRIVTATNSFRHSVLER